MKSWRTLLCTALVVVVACSGEEADDDDEPQCIDASSADFDADSGWDSANYCDAPTDLGCYPWHESSEDTCGPFTTMRTSATTSESAAACETLLTALNCAEFESEDGESRLGFYLADADRFTMDVVGTYRGTAVDTTFYFNPCQPNCLSVVTLDAVDADQQKICEIPRQGKPACLFPDTAHTLTFVRADGGSVVIRSSGEETAMGRVTDAESGDAQ